MGRGSPFGRIAAWTDDNPLSAAGVVVAAGALAGLALDADAGSAGGQTLSGGGAATAVAETALAQPAYVVVAVVGLVVFAAYDG